MTVALVVLAYLAVGILISRLLVAHDRRRGVATDMLDPLLCIVLWPVQLVFTVLIGVAVVVAGVAWCLARLGGWREKA